MLNKKIEKKTSIKKIFAIAAGKGGVGKSTLTVHLAIAMKALGLKTGILDADLYGPSLRKMLPEDRPPSQKEGFFYPAKSFGIEIISMSYFKKEKEAAAIRAPIANGIITEFLNRVIWDDLDVLLIDFPPGTGDIQLTLCQKAGLDAALLITTPQEISLIDVQKCAHLFNELRVPLLGIVENMSYYTPPGTEEKISIFGKGGGEKLAKQLGIPFLKQIPIEPLISKGGDLGTPLNATDANHPVSQQFFSLAKKLQEEATLLNEQTHFGLKDFSLPWELNLPPLSSPFQEKKPESQPPPSLLFIKKITQLDPTSFSILWNDGALLLYHLSELQKNCPCASCFENPPKLNKDVSAKLIQSVGRYALQIVYTSGCSHGIYDFSTLRNFAAQTLQKGS